MKQINLIFTVILLFNLGLKCQDYVPFPTKNVNWNIYLLTTCSETTPDTILLRYTIRGDTTINEIQYSKLCIESSDTLNPSIQSIGGFRESDKKVYYKGHTIFGNDNDNEYLLYDFTKQIGDTIKHDLQGGFYSVVLDIDSVLIMGNYRKRYQVDNHWYYQNLDYIIEGIGSVKNGLLGHVSDIPTCGYHYWEHVCFMENGVVKYLNPTFDKCFPDHLLTSANTFELNSEFRLFPNPFGKELRVLNKTNYNNLLIRVININGKPGQSLLKDCLNRLILNYYLS